MILQKVKQGTVTKALYQSSNIVASEYDEASNDLNVTFKNGGNYTYQNVPETDYVRFETASSQGVLLNSTIKQYPFQKNQNVNINEVVDTINNLKQEEITEFGATLASSLESTHTFYTQTGGFEHENLERLSRMITIYQDLTR